VIEASPKTLIENRNWQLAAQQVALQDINARLLAHKAVTTDLTKMTRFQAAAATSSNETVLAVTSTTSAALSNYNFTVERQVNTQ